MILYETKFLSLKTAKKANGGDWYYALRPNAKNIVVILPLIENEYILFLVTKRPPLINENIAKYCIELPAGLVGDENSNETTEDALKRELLEETGLMADYFKIMTKKLASSSGLTSEISTVAIGYISNKSVVSKPSSDGGVIADRIYVKKSEIFNFLKEKEENGFAISAQALAALFYLFAGA